MEGLRTIDRSQAGVVIDSRAGVTIEQGSSTQGQQSNMGSVGSLGKIANGRTCASYRCPIFSGEKIYSVLAIYKKKISAPSILFTKISELMFFILMPLLCFNRIGVHVQIINRTVTTYQLGYSSCSHKNTICKHLCWTIAHLYFISFVGN